MYLLPAARRTAMAKPNGRTVTVDAIIVRDLFARSQVSKRDDSSAAIHRLHIAIWIARMIDVALRRLHQHHFSAEEVVAMPRIFPGFEGMQLIHDSGVVDF